MSKRNQPLYRRGSEGTRRIRCCLCLLDQKDARCRLTQKEEVLTDFIREGLTGRQEEYLRLYYNDGLTQQQIAARLGIQTPAVSRGIRRGEAQLFRALGHVERLDSPGA